MRRLVAAGASFTVTLLVLAAVTPAFATQGYFIQRGYANLGIPPGHLPPPGECRIWYPGRPAGHQPPPGKCASLSLRVPLGAWLLYRPKDDTKHVRVSVYDPRGSGQVIIIGVFVVSTGVFVVEFRPR